MKNILMKLVVLTLFALPMTGHAFSINGTVLKVSAEGQYNGACAIQLSKPIGNGCTGSWLSLDCQEKFSAGGDRKYATAMLAFSLNKSVTAFFDAKQKQGVYCVAKRVDVLQ